MKSGAKYLEWVIDIENALTQVMIVLGRYRCRRGCSNAEWPEDFNRESQGRFFDQVAKLRFLLTISTIVLVIGVIQVGFEYRWAFSGLNAYERQICE